MVGVAPVVARTEKFVMRVPEKSDPRWQSMIDGSRTPELSFLGARMLLAHLRAQYDRDPSPITMSISVDALRSIYMRNCDLPEPKQDMLGMFGNDNS